MLASIVTYAKSPDEDILIFLNDKEIRSLSDNPLSGVIFEYRDIRKLYPFELGVGMQQAGPFEVKDGSETYKVFLGKNHYPVLAENGWLGGTCGYRKIDMASENFANQDRELGNWLRNMNLRWNNRDKIIENLEKEEL